MSIPKANNMIASNFNKVKFLLIKKVKLKNENHMLFFLQDARIAKEEFSYF
jgi:hypothetical protein